MPQPIIPIPPDCPWSTWARGNVGWCESVTRCGVIVNPVLASTNILYALVGLYLLRHAKSSSFRYTKQMGLASMLVGISSGSYHATCTLFFQLFDFVGMYAYLALPLSLNLVRAALIAPDKLWPSYASILALSAAGIPLCQSVGLPYQLIVFGLILACLGLDLHCARTSGGFGAEGRWLGWTVFFIASAAVFSATDQLNIHCYPESLYQGHGVWHLLGAISMYFHHGYYVALVDAGKMPSGRVRPQKQRE
uniref:Alkaline ceramidase n=1 Tax=Sexangularia sp. CB-2014 TaxID=1486929 RepID=A0A7S1VBP5_9EUKA